jgi:hypothetical protein
MMKIWNKNTGPDFKHVVIKDRERDVQVWKNDKVYFKWVWNKSPFDINSVVFHFDEYLFFDRQFRS